MESCEHVAVGDAITLSTADGAKAPATSTKLPVGNRLLSYGHLIALGGDFYGVGAQPASPGHPALMALDPISSSPSPEQAFSSAYLTLAGAPAQRARRHPRRDGRGAECHRCGQEGQPGAVSRLREARRQPLLQVERDHRRWPGEPRRRQHPDHAGPLHRPRLGEHGPLREGCGHGIPRGSWAGDEAGRPAPRPGPELDGGEDEAVAGLRLQCFCRPLPDGPLCRGTHADAPAGSVGHACRRSRGRQACWREPRTTRTTPTACTSRTRGATTGSPTATARSSTPSTRRTSRWPSRPRRRPPTRSTRPS